MRLLRLLVIAAFGTALTATGAAAAEVPTDSQIAEIVVKANQVDVDAGHLAEAKASTEEVRAFAEEMVMAHTTIGEEARALITRLGITPAPSLTSHSLEGGGASNIERLSTVRGADFDRAYVGHEVAYHQQILQAMDDALIPNARSPDLAAMLRAVRPMFVAHLEHAKRLRDSL
jgi:putative membrane protein